VFNNLKEPKHVYTCLCQSKGEEAIYTSIQDVFNRHNMWNKFGVTLLHRHFKMEPSERLVAVRDTSTPWGPDAYNTHPLGEVLPQAFIFTAPDTILPYEYTFFTTESLGKAVRFKDATRAFLVEIGSLLFSTGLATFLGLRVHPGDELKQSKLEFTVERANININVDEASVNSIPTSWYFDGPKKLRCSCHSHCLVTKDDNGNDEHTVLSHVHT